MTQITDQAAERCHDIEALISDADSNELVEIEKRLTATVWKVQHRISIVTLEKSGDTE